MGCFFFVRGGSLGLFFLLLGFFVFFPPPPPPQKFTLDCLSTPLLDTTVRLRRRQRSQTLWFDFSLDAVSPRCWCVTLGKLAATRAPPSNGTAIKSNREEENGCTSTSAMKTAVPSETLQTHTEALRLRCWWQNFKLNALKVLRLLITFSVDSLLTLQWFSSEWKWQEWRSVHTCRDSSDYLGVFVFRKWSLRCWRLFWLF